MLAKLVFLGALLVSCSIVLYNSEDVDGIEESLTSLVEENALTDDDVEKIASVGAGVDANEDDRRLNLDIQEIALDEDLISKYKVESEKNVTEPERNNTKVTIVTCVPRSVEKDPAVKIVNNSVLLNIIVPESNITANECVLVLFYAPWCHFSAAAAPHYNALARVFPSVHILAVNAVQYNNLNTRFSIIAVPTLILFHNGRPICKYNETTYTLEKLVTFVNKHTGLSPLGLVNVTSADFEGPLSSEAVQETDYIFWISCMFILFCCALGFAKSSLCHYILESIHSNWQEAEAQHEHAE